MSESAQPLQALLSEGGSSEAVMKVFTQLLGKMLEDEEPEKPVDPQTHPAFRRLRRERDLLARRNHLIARSLGACDCWGGDERCQRCAGQGVPGYFVPDEALLADVLGPLFELRMDMVLPYLEAEPEAVLPEPMSHAQEKE